MKPYEFLPHTGDVKFKARGKTLATAFKNAAYAFTDVMTDHTNIKKKISKRISIESEDEMSLLYDFLEEFVVLVDSKGFLLNNIEELKIIKKDKGFRLVAKVTGDRVNHTYDINAHIKAVTYQQMYVKKSKGTYILQVILDI